MKIVHCHNIAGVASTLAKYQARLGVQTSVIVRRRHPFGFPESRVGRFRGLMTLAGGDLIHYHWTSWMENIAIANMRNPDARLFSFLGKPLVVHYHGDDLRRNLVNLAFKPEYKFVSTADLLEYAPESEWLPNPVDCEVFTRVERGSVEVHRVGYYDAPPGSGYVPTKEIERAVAKLRGEGFRVETAPARRLHYDQMPGYYRSLTIWVDKLEVGAYSLMACEAASSGLPVIASTSKIRSHLGEEVFYEFSGDLTEDLRYLIEHEKELGRIAQKGRSFVQARHEASRIAKRTVDVYRSIM